MQEDPGLLVEKPADDVGARRLVRRGGEGDHLRAAKQSRGAAKFTIFRAKIMSPFGNAMRFVDGETGEARAAQLVDQPVHQQPFRRYEQQPQFARAQGSSRLRVLGGVVLRVQRRRRHA